MRIAELYVSMNAIEVRQLLRLTRGTVGATVMFTFGPEWDGLSKTAIFRTNAESRDIVNVQEGVPVEIPWEVLDQIDDELMVGVYGFNETETVLIPTVWASLKQIYPSALPSGQLPQPPSPDWTQQVRSQVNRAMQASAQALEAADNISYEEGKRARAEIQRLRAESERCRNEEQRCAAEAQRVERSQQQEQEQYLWEVFSRNADTAEAARAEAETLRGSREGDRRTAEQGRKEAEAQRMDGESQRSTEEKVRTAAEEGRASAEQSRASAEALRTDGENRRQQEENRRREAEKIREQAERSRIEAENNRRNFIRDQEIEAGTGWSSENIVNTLCPSFQKTAPVVSCHPAQRYPLEVISRISPVQEGSGLPGHDNIRPIRGKQQVSMVHCGENLWETAPDFRGNDRILYDADSQKFTLLPGTGSFCIPVGRLLQAIPAGTELAVRIYPEQGFLKWGAGVSVGLGPQENPGSTEAMVALPEAEILRNTVISTEVTLREPAEELRIVCTDPRQIYESPVFRVGLYLNRERKTFVPHRGETRSVQLPQTVFGGSYNWKTGRLSVEREFFTLPPDGAWSDQIGQGNSLALALGNYGYGYSDDILCENFPISYNVGDINNKNNFVMARSGMLYVPFATREEVRKALTEHPVRLLLHRKQPLLYQLKPERLPAGEGVNTLYSDSGDTTVNSREDLPHAFQALQNQLLELQNHTIGGV